MVNIKDNCSFGIKGSALYSDASGTNLSHYCVQFYKTTRTLQLEQERYSTGASGREGFTLGRMIF